MPYKTRSPILLIAHSRPHTTARVLSAIRAAEPRQLFFFVDGPRAYTQGDSRNVAQVRALASSVDWECQLRTEFLEPNLGCRNGVTRALSWFFEQVDEGIILEDDCVPNGSFFRFCDEMLSKYRNNTRIVHISGSNALRVPSGLSTSYYFSKYPHIWGWATWKRAFRNFPELVSGKRSYSFDRGERYLAERREKKFWRHRWTRELQGLVDNWDSLWNLHCWMGEGLSIAPSETLVNNIGYGPDGTHATRYPLIAGPPPVTRETKFPLVHPTTIEPDTSRDLFVTRAVYGLMPFTLKLVLASSELIRRNLGITHLWKKKPPAVTVAQHFWRWWLAVGPKSRET